MVVVVHGAGGTVVTTVAATRTTKGGSRSSAPKKGAPGRKTAASRTKAAPKAPPITERVSRTASVAVEGHHADVWGLALVTAGVLVGLGVYADVAGPFGQAVDTVVGAAVGMVKLAVPVALAVAGIAVLRGSEPDDPDADLEHRGARFALSSILLLVAACGLLHLGRGEPGLDDGLDALGDAGGLLGLAVAGPLHALLDSPGTQLLLGALAVVGLVILTQTSVRTFAGRAAGVGGYLRSLGGGLF